MKQNLIAKSLLDGTGVSENDEARLTLEAIETLGELATGTSRPAQGCRSLLSRGRIDPELKNTPARVGWGPA